MSGSGEMQKSESGEVKNSRTALKKLESGEVESCKNEEIGVCRSEAVKIERCEKKLSQEIGGWSVRESKVVELKKLECGEARLDNEDVKK